MNTNDIQKIIDGVKTNGVKLSKIIVPIHIYDIDSFFNETDYEIRIWAIAQHLKRANLINDATGYIASIKSESRNFDTFTKLNEILGSEIVYINISDLRTFIVNNSKNKDKFPFFEDYVDSSILASMFKKYMSHISFNDDDYSIKKNLESKSDEFFKFIPHIKAFVNPYFSSEFGLGYCCEDCDGDYTTYKSYRIEDNISNIDSKIKTITLKCNVKSN